MEKLAKQITEAYFFYDPYNGADFEDVERAVLEGLTDAERMREMLDELSAMVLNMN